MKTRIILAVVVSVGISFSASAQNYTTIGAGNWTAPGKWNNTSGWGTSTPPINGTHGSGVITMGHDMSINTNYSLGSATLNINAGKTLTISGDMLQGGGSTVNVFGNLVITGNLTLNGYLTIRPGGSVTVIGNVYVNSSNYLTIGTNVASPPYADLAVKGDLRQQGSGDVTVNRNGRVAIFGSVTDGGGGGTYLTLAQGAQMYVDDNISYTGGGNSINNNNSGNPYGLYVGGTTSNPGGGSTTTSNLADENVMQATNPGFASWVSIQAGVMPVTLLFFKVSEVNQYSVSLQWATASEKNFDLFVVESSIDGSEFTELGRVKGHGMTTVRQDYSFTVSDPAVGRSYYRLKSIDFDGYTEIFNVVSADFEAAKSARLFPNPVVGSQLNVEFNFQLSEDITISITSLTGLEVARLSVNGMENLLTLSLDPGTYLVRVSSHEVNTVTRIVFK